MTRRLFLLFVLCSTPSWAALSATVQWDVRTTGSDSNSGGFDPGVGSPGTDYSQQNSPQITYTDLVVGATTTQYTSVLHVVSSTLPGNTLVVTGGTGCTTGTFEILSNATITATVDRSLGTAASVCTAVLGGSNATICSSYSSGNCTAGAMSVAVNSNTIWVKSGTYTITTSYTSKNAAAAVVSPITFEGYGSTHADFGTKPIITTSTNSIEMFTLTAGWTNFINLDLQSTAATAEPMIYVNASVAYVVAYRMKFDTSGAGTNANAFQVFNANTQFISVDSEYSLGSGQNALEDGGDGTIVDFFYLDGNYFHGGASAFSDYATGSGPDERIVANHNVFASMARGINSTVLTLNALALQGNDFYNMTDECVKIGSTAIYTETAVNNIFYGCTYGLYNTQAPSIGVSLNNAFGSIGTANYNAFVTSLASSDITLTANPWVNTSTPNYALNSTSGGGALLKAAGFPGVTPAGTGYLDVGALQSQAATGGGAYVFVQ